MEEKDFLFTQDEEQKTWNFEGNKQQIQEKLQREKARYYLMAKQMGLTTCIETHKMYLMDIGSSCTGGISTILPYKKRVAVDPLRDEYAKYHDVTGMIGMRAEDLKERLNEPCCIICSNSIDHFKEPITFLKDLVKYMKYGAYFSIYSAINNHLTHPHPAHFHSLNEAIIEEIFQEDFEIVWKMNYKNDNLVYGWTHQPSFIYLFRRINQPNKELWK